MLNRKTTLYPLGILIALSVSTNAFAKPWLDTGDIRLRHQIQLLSDSGVLDTPITTWPLTSRDIYTHLSPNDANKNLQNTIDSVNKRLAQEDYGSSFQVSGQINSKKLLIRDFSGEGREEGSVSYDGEWGNPIVDMRLKAAIAEKSSHPSDRNFRLDESYLSGTFNNWKFTVGQQSRWWGPGWDGSLILSNNARPIPSVSFDRVDSQPFKNKYLRWLGPWKLSLFAGRLESSRKVSNAKLLGARFNFVPTPTFEVGLSRTAQWGGSGRSETFSTLFNTIIGKDNFGGKNEPGNQLAGIDFRWKSPIGKSKPYAVYGQLIGEDEAGMLPFKSTGLLGLETWGHSKRLDGTWRLYIEGSNTSTDFFQGEKHNNIAYNHHVYGDGYRYLGNSLGHGIDSDSNIIGVGGILAKNNGDLWRGWIKHASLNKDGVGLNPISPNGKTWSGAGISVDKSLAKQTKLKLGIQFTSEKESGHSADNNVGISIGFTRFF